MLKKVLKRIGYVFLGLIALIVLLVAISVWPIDRYDYHEKSFYKDMLQELDTVNEQAILPSSDKFSVGYSKVNLTPAQRVATAGYGNRRGKLYTSLHDSIYVRAMVITQGQRQVALVSADLLIIPPTVNALLKERLPEIGFSIGNTYLGATHSHNSIGNWGEGVAEFMYGSYSDSIVTFITDRILMAITAASENTLPATIGTTHIPVSKGVRNRIDDNGGLDSLLHLVEVRRSDNTKLILTSYTAHATCLFSRDLELSRDYPGKLVDELEKRGYAFAMFMAGAVGSHGCNPPEYGWSCIDWMADLIVKHVEENQEAFRPLRDSVLMMYRVPLILSEPQAKVSKDWKARPWVFRSAFGEYPVDLVALRIGELLMLGTPCDYSGELTPSLYAAGEEEGLQVMVTSFNGGYIGYVTPDKYYDVDHYETRLMNWYGPGSGSYMDEYLKHMVRASKP